MKKKMTRKIYLILHSRSYGNEYLSYDLDKFLCFKSVDIRRICTLMSADIENERDKWERRCVVLFQIKYTDILVYNKPSLLFFLDQSVAGQGNRASGL